MFQNHCSKIIDQNHRDIIVARDSRLSSPILFAYLTEGIISTGVNVIDIGIVPTPVLYFATHELTSSNGVVITGSHNPSDYNGFKFTFQRESFFGDKIQELYAIMKNKQYNK